MGRKANKFPTDRFLQIEHRMPGMGKMNEIIVSGFKK